MRIYYTYHILNPITNKVFYVGKGYGQRAYIHMTRALKWRETGKIVPGGNRHLYNTLLKIHDTNLEPIYSIVFESTIEKEALDREEQDIKFFGLENLCNLTHGGEGETRSPESLKKISIALQKFWDSNDGYVLKEEFSKNRMGDKNPRWGVIEDEEHKANRMAPMLSKPRWNVGLKGDPRSKGPAKGSVPINALPCRLTNEDGRVFEAKSIKELSQLSGVPLISIQRIHLGIYKKNKKGWRFELIK